MHGTLLAIAIVAGAIGFAALSQATLGVGLLVGACLFGIFARIAQAREHQREWRARHPAQPPAVW